MNAMAVLRYFFARRENIRLWGAIFPTFVKEFVGSSFHRNELQKSFYIAENAKISFYI